jgi:hypothetical protein
MPLKDSDSDWELAHMRRSPKPVTIHDVAEAAGVSVSTVSRVLNDKDDVAQETYDRVRQLDNRKDGDPRGSCPPVHAGATSVRASMGCANREKHLGARSLPIVSAVA